ncbi:LCP family protein [Sinomonas halotolerans]|uniref:LCP family protein n=1 Tax=Sinomonas halotolerans TaxID=1644133 RepID=A0ABU9X0X6_9MICC
MSSGPDGNSGPDDAGASGGSGAEETGGPEDMGGAPGGPGGRRRLAFAVAGLLALIGALVAAMLVTLPRGGEPAAEPTATPSPTASATPKPTAKPAATLPALPPGALNVLVIGSDIRGNAREAASRQSAGGSADHRSDMLMLVHVPADRKRVYGISIMRDTWIDIPGHGPAKINAALEMGGPPLTSLTVGNLLHTRISHWVMIDFEGFKRLTQALGGIKVNVPVSFTATHDTHSTFKAGPMTLSGQAALEFVRERYTFPDGDYQRVRNQQAFVRGIIDTLLRGGKVRDPASAIRVIAAVTPYVTGEPGFSAREMATLAYGLRGVDAGRSIFFTLPTAGTGTSPDGQSIVIPDQAGIDEVAAALQSGRLAQYAAAKGLR